MAQQLLSDYPIDPTVTSGTALADILNRTSEVFNSTNSGPTRPSTLKAGGLWTKTGGASLELYLFDGTRDIFYSAIGPAGPQGPAGTAGPQGPAGPSAVSAQANNTTILGTDGLIFTRQASATEFGTVVYANTSEAQSYATSNRVLSPASLANAFQGNHTLGPSGFQKFPGNLLVQWGIEKTRILNSVQARNFNFPISFPNVVWTIYVTRANLLNPNNEQTFDQIAVPNGNGAAIIYNVTTQVDNPEVTYYWFAIGA